MLLKDSGVTARPHISNPTGKLCRLIARSHCQHFCHMTSQSLRAVCSSLEASQEPQHAQLLPLWTVSSCCSRSSPWHLLALLQQPIQG